MNRVSVGYIVQLTTLGGRACFSIDRVCCGSARLFVTFGGSGGMMTTTRPGLPYPCSLQAKTRDESSRRGSNMTG